MGYHSYSGPLPGAMLGISGNGAWPPPLVGGGGGLLYLPESMTACQETLDLNASPQTGRRLQVRLLLAQPEVTTDGPALGPGPPSPPLGLSGASSCGGGDRSCIGNCTSIGTSSGSRPILSPLNILTSGKSAVTPSTSSSGRHKNCTEQICCHGTRSSTTFIANPSKGDHLPMLFRRLSGTSLCVHRPVFVSTCRCYFGA